MCSRCLRAGALAVLMYAAAVAQAPPVLKVCADPENLPFSNQRRQGFENRLAEVVARGLGRKLEYRWARHTGRGFVRNILNAGECDLLLSVPHGFPPVLTTEPYYTSSYVFVTRAERDIRSFDDESLQKLKIGVQVVEEEYAPPAMALVRRGLLQNMVGYEAIGKDAGNIVRAVAKGEVDVAVIWGPLAGYYARRYGDALRITPAPAFDGPALPLSFSISMGVRKRDPELREQVQEVLRKHRAEVERILREFGVPQPAREERRAQR
jgi:mxaJ protein